MEVLIDGKLTIDAKSEDEAIKKVMKLLKNTQGTMLFPLPDWDPEEQHPDPNDEITAEQLISRIKSRDAEIQDLKLENDRLTQQNELMIGYIHALACIESKKSKFYSLCESGNCPYYDHDKEFGKGACKLGSRDLIEKEAANIIDKLEDL